MIFFHLKVSGGQKGLKQVAGGNSW